MDLIPEVIRAVDPARITRDLFYLAQDPLPCRTLNYVVPGRDQCTLFEADEYIRNVLASGGYQVSEEGVAVQAFVPDPDAPWGFRKPLTHEPWFEARNIYAVKSGSSAGTEVVIVLAHKDSQSWLECGPGAYDNGVGVAALLEISRLVADLDLRRSVMLLFCNEEHWPWTSVHAAERIANSAYEPVAVLNLDSIGGKSATDVEQGLLSNIVRYSTQEGEALADLISNVNERYEIGLTVGKAWSAPNDDDGSFVNAGILSSVLMIGSYPYADPNYHTLDDTPEQVDTENVRLATQLALATVLVLCESSKPRR